MNKRFVDISEKINALSLRERVMVIVTIVALSGFAWWNLYALPVLVKTRQVNQQNKILLAEMQTLDATATAIQKRIDDGVHKTRQQKLKLLKQELQKISDLLESTTLALIEPDEMFELMQQLIFSESKLKLTEMKRKLVKPAFPVDENDTDQPEIYRHVLQMSFEGNYKNVLKYIQKLEALDWKLIWDQITLKTTEYPVITVDIEISTLSGNKYWVGL